MTIIAGSFASHDLALVMVLKVGLEPGSLQGLGSPPRYRGHQAAGRMADQSEVRGVVLSVPLVWVKQKHCTY